MVEREAKVKIRKCIVCGKEFNKYTRPWGLYEAKHTCSEECHEVRKNQIKRRERLKQELNRDRMKEKLKTFLRISLITGVFGAVIGGLFLWSSMGILGVLIGFAIGFLAPSILYIIVLLLP